MIFRRRRRLTIREVKRLLAAQGQVTVPPIAEVPKALQAALREADRRNERQR